MTDALNVYVVECGGGTDWFVARSREDAAKLWLDLYGERQDDYPELPDVVTELAQDETLTIMADCYGGAPKESKTARAWAASNGRGFLCSTEW